jgi:hypothetical protein
MDPRAKSAMPLLFLFIFVEDLQSIKTLPHFYTVCFYLGQRRGHFNSCYSQNRPLSKLIFFGLLV